MKLKTALLLFLALCVAAIMLGAFALANAAEVESVRDSQYEWTCEDSAGNVISGHTRQDKAFQSCYNAALASGEVFYVRGGSFRVTATGTTAPPPEPNPEPEPPPPVPTPAPQVTFGPVSSLTEYPATIGALKQNGFRWVIKATVNSLPSATDEYMGLASRDEAGQAEKGHISIWVNPDGTVGLRNQDIAAAGPAARLTSSTALTIGQEHEIVVSLRDGQYVALWVDGNFEGATTEGYGLADNNLPLIVGGLCRSCDTITPPAYPVDGTVYMEIWDDQIPPPQPTASLELSWVNPTSYENGNPIGPGELTEIRLFRDGIMVAGVDPDQAAHEVTDLYPGQEYCFEATAVAEQESDRSNRVCKAP